MSQSKSEVISLRIDDDLKKKLLVETTRKKIPFNHLVNQILKLHVSWDEFGTQMGRLSVSRRTFRTFLNSLDEKKIVEIARTIAKEEYKTAAKFYFGKSDLHCVIQFMENWLDAADLKFRHITNGEKNSYIINHDLGKNWSILFLTRLETILSEFGYKLLEKNPDKQCFSFEIVKVQ